MKTTRLLMVELEEVDTEEAGSAGDWLAEVLNKGLAQTWGKYRASRIEDTDCVTVRRFK